MNSVGSGKFPRNLISNQFKLKLPRNRILLTYPEGFSDLDSFRYREGYLFLPIAILPMVSVWKKVDFYESFTSPPPPGKIDWVGNI